MTDRPAPEATTTFENRVEAERERRRGFNGGWHYWSAAGRDQPTLPEHWCHYCAGYFGVPHAFNHDESPCRYRFQDGLCACIDCWVLQNREDRVGVTDCERHQT